MFLRMVAIQLLLLLTASVTQKAGQSEMIALDVRLWSHCWRLCGQIVTTTTVAVGYG